MKTDITSIIECIIALFSALITTFLIPYVKSKLSESRFQQIQFWAKTAVEAAEQLYGSKAGQQKKDYVVSFLLSKGIVMDIDDVTALIESEVYKMSSVSQGCTR
ncbi:MAG: phage holin, LLH family [Oscillospiraceae bacterium]|nr:phage holin, LLH family [Oscillospiraceae bacterium]MDD6147244.1 phage holin, LLH family [Oscillospiraceae bacterium]